MVKTPFNLTKIMKTIGRMDGWQIFLHIHPKNAERERFSVQSANFVFNKIFEYD